jgi:hypothetical protein
MNKKILKAIEQRKPLDYIKREINHNIINIDLSLLLSQVFLHQRIDVASYLLSERIIEQQIVVKDRDILTMLDQAESCEDSPNRRFVISYLTAKSLLLPGTIYKARSYEDPSNRRFVISYLTARSLSSGATYRDRSLSLDERDVHILFDKLHMFLFRMGVPDVFISYLEKIKNDFPDLTPRLDAIITFVTKELAKPRILSEDATKALVSILDVAGIEPHPQYAPEKFVAWLSKEDNVRIFDGIKQKFLERKKYYPGIVNLDYNLNSIRGCLSWMLFSHDTRNILNRALSTEINHLERSMAGCHAAMVSTGRSGRMML